VQAGCPGAVPSGSCTMPGQTCNYPTEACICSSGQVVSNMLSWNCSMLTAGCPQDPPSIGSTCDPDGLVCNYGWCLGGEEVKCTTGHWAKDEGLCAGG
jgi:hypothetical protein